MSTSERLFDYLKVNGPATYIQMLAAMGCTTGTLDKAINALRDQGRVREVKVGEAVGLAVLNST